MFDLPRFDNHAEFDEYGAGGTVRRVRGTAEEYDGTVLEARGVWWYGTTGTVTVQRGTAPVCESIFDRL